MIQFDAISQPVITPELALGPRGRGCEICIATFSHKIHAHVLERFPCEKIAELRGCNGPKPIYGLEYRGKRIAFYLSSVGSAMAGNDLIEAAWLTGANQFIFFGSAGCLNQAATKGKFVLPAAAYRDEGMSYHYAPESDYIQMPGARKLTAIFDELRLPYALGQTWTTDAFYRETQAKLQARRAEGCLTVEMEAAGLQAVCDYYHYRLYQFLMTGDVLDLPEWERADLHEANHRLDNFQIALEIAARL